MKWSALRFALLPYYRRSKLILRKLLLTVKNNTSTIKLFPASKYMSLCKQSVHFFFFWNKKPVQSRIFLTLSFWSWITLSFEEISSFKNDVYTINISELLYIDTVRCTAVGINVEINSVVTKITQSLSQ